MAEATTNANRDRPATDTDYQPIAGTAVAAICVAGVLVLLIVLLGGNSFRKGKPLLYSWLLAVAVVGFALSVTARFQIRRSEGTRSGMRLANIAWWTTILLGAGYAAYLYASKLALARQSQEYAMEWFALLQDQADGSPAVREAKFYASFYRTLEPTSRANILPEEKEQLEIDFASQLPSYRSSRLLRFFQRAGKEIEITPKGIGNWEQTPTGYQVEQVFQLRSPEGVFEVVLRMSASEGKSIQGRQWRIATGEDPLQRSVTSYGYAIGGLEMDARKFGEDWVSRWVGMQWENTYLLTLPHDQRPAGDLATNETLQRALFVRPYHCLVGSVAAFFIPAVTTAEPAATEDDRRKAKLLEIYRAAPILAGGCIVPVLPRQLLFAELQSRDFFHLTIDKDQGSGLLFRDIWRYALVMRAEELRLPNSESIGGIRVSADDVKVTMPIYFPLPGGQRMASAVIVIRSTDPALLKELHELHDAGQADPSKSGLPDVLDRLPPRRWQIYSIESNLKPFKLPSRMGPPPPGG